MSELAERTEPDRPVQLSAAAERLGISVDGVRMRIRRGQLRGEKIGRVWYVYLTERTGQAEPNRTEQTSSVRSASSDGAAQIIARQDAEIAYLRGALEREQVASAEFRRLLQQATAPRQLAQPVDVAVQAPEMTATPPAAAASTTDSTPAAKPRPWWRIW